VVTAVTKGSAAQTDRVITDVAATRTLVTEIEIALVASVAVLRCDRSTAIVAGHTVPLVQRDIGAVRVVGVENVRYQCEEVTQSTLLQGLSYGDCAVAFAQYIVRYVRVSDGLVSARRVGLLGQTSVRCESVQGFELFQCQFNTKPAKIDAAHLYTVCHDGKSQFVRIELNRSQFPIEFQKICEDCREGWQSTCLKTVFSETMCSAIEVV